MKLIDRIKAEIVALMKEKQADKLTALRMLHSEIKNVGTNAGVEETDELVLKVIAKAIKQRTDALEQYKAAGRPELAAKEEMEIALFRKYQPVQLGEAELEQIVRQHMTTTGAKTKKEMGALIKSVMAEVQGRADGKAVSTMAGKLLQ